MARLRVLLIDGGGDPYFVDENALLVAQRLNDQACTGWRECCVHAAITV
jgi:hypothetical protein